jgi:hypothetical protein
MRLTSFLFTAVLLSAAFAGCTGNSGPAVADFAAIPLTENKSSYRFDASNSSGPGLAYTWDFGDMSPPGTGPVVEHTYQYLNGDYSVKLTVAASDGTTAEIVKKVKVGTSRNSDPLLYLKTDKRWIAPGESVTFDATQSYDPDADPIIFKWDFNSPRADNEFSSMENLGSQQYGIYKYGAPPEQDAPQDDGNASGEGTLLTPSGYDWHVEYEKAKQRAMQALGVSTFDGNHSVAPEPRNADFDGKISDTSPIQIFTFPDAATYFVHVQVIDIKGTKSEGFIRINVDPNVPESSFSASSSGTLAPAVFGNLDLEQARSYVAVPFGAGYPAEFFITLTYAANPSGAPAPTLAGYVCGSNLNIGDCRNKDTKLAPWESGATYSFQVTPASVGTYQVFFETTGNSAGASYEYTIDGIIEPNKWFKEEAGLGGH